jgi:hypothetical protein
MTTATNDRVTCAGNVSYRVLDLIAEDFTVRAHSVDYANVVRLGTRRGVIDSAATLRVTIHCDGYDDQSYAKVEVWRADGWTLVHYVHGADARVKDLPRRASANADALGAREQYGDLSTELIKLATRVVA